MPEEFWVYYAFSGFITGIISILNIIPKTKKEIQDHLNRALKSSNLEEHMDSYIFGVLYFIPILFFSTVSFIVLLDFLLAP